MSAFAFPFCAIGAALLPTLVHAWLNPKWFDAILPGRALLLAAAAWVSFYGAGALFLGLNRQRSEALVNVLQNISIVIVAIAAGPFGLTVAALALAVRPLLLIGPVALMVRRTCQVRARVFLGSQALPLTASLVAGAIVWVLQERTEVLLGSPLALVALGAAGFAVYGILLASIAPDRLRLIIPTWARRRGHPINANVEE
jgi:O-antigen/teichoic acid export membrane protein